MIVSMANPLSLMGLNMAARPPISQASKRTTPIRL